MLQNLKRYAVIASISVALLGCAFIGGYMVCKYKTKPIAVETQGEIIGKTNIGKPPVVENTMDDNCGHSPYIAWCNLMYEDYKRFLSSVPEVENVTANKIIFKLYTQKYALTYSARDEANWWFAPAAYARVSIPQGAHWGAGILGGFGDIGAGIILDSALSISALIFYRFEIK